MSLGLRGASRERREEWRPACAIGSPPRRFGSAWRCCRRPRSPIAVVLASAITFQIVRSELRGEVDRSLKDTVEPDLRAGRAAAARHRPGPERAGASSRPARQPRRVRAGRAAERLRGPPARQHRPPPHRRAGAGGRRGRAESLLHRRDHRRGPRARVHGVRANRGCGAGGAPAGGGGSHPSRPDVRADTGGARRRRAGPLARSARGARRAHARQAAHRRGRARGADTRPVAPDPGGPQRRAQPAWRQLQHDAGGARLLAGGATTAGGGRLARAAHPAHQPAHQHRGARVRRRVGERTASGSCRTWSPSWAS